ARLTGWLTILALVLGTGPSWPNSLITTLFLDANPIAAALMGLTGDTGLSGGVVNGSSWKGSSGSGGGMCASDAVGVPYKLGTWSGTAGKLDASELMSLLMVLCRL